jgi:cystathionine beta-lyase
MKMKKPDSSDSSFGIDTTLVTTGRDPHANFGFVNPPVYHGSTILFPTAEKLVNLDQEYRYGRRGTPTSRALETAVTEIENGYASKIMSSGLGAITTALFAVIKAGDHILMTDAVYRPARMFCDDVLAGLGVETTYYDPTIGAGIAELMRPNTAVVYTESPGTQTMEVQDIPAIVEVAHAHGALVVCDNTWATGVYFRPLDLGVDMSMQAGTKYIVGHSDVMLGAVTTTEALWPKLLRTYDNVGQCVGPDDIYLGLRGIRTMSVRLERHMASALDIASWLEGRDEVHEVLHPGLPSNAGHELWKRDFTGATGLFSVVLETGPREAAMAFLDALQLFGMGFSWGGYESLAILFDPSGHRKITPWDTSRIGVRFHIGLEDIDDLKTDLDNGFAAWRKAMG